MVEAVNFGNATAKEWSVAALAQVEQSRAYKQAISAARTSLPNSAYESLLDECERAEVYKVGTKEVLFESPVLGSIAYNVPTSTFNASAFEDILKRKQSTIYANNSLASGNMPWAYCYGSYNSCKGNNCSQIVVNSGSVDMVVTIKDSDGEVVRHAYIKRNSSFTFNIPNGRYQPFFLYGTGWNPNKVMKQAAACGVLKGGFIAAEQVGKDDMQYLNSQILTYTMRQTTFGNFNTDASNANEAL